MVRSSAAVRTDGRRRPRSQQAQRRTWPQGGAARARSVGRAGGALETESAALRLRESPRLGAAVTVQRRKQAAAQVGAAARDEPRRPRGTPACSARPRLPSAAASQQEGADSGLDGAGLRGRSPGRTNLNCAPRLDFPVGGEHGAAAQGCGDLERLRGREAETGG